MTKNQSIPTINKFRNSLIKGIDYTNPGKPEAIQLSVSENGQTARAAEIHIQRCANIANEWRMLAAEADVHKEKNVAHQKTYEAMTSEISAATAYLNSQSAWANFQASQARLTIAQGDAKLAIASVPIQAARQSAELQKQYLQLEQTLLEVNKLRDDVAHVRVMNALNGYNIEVALPPGVGAEVFSANIQQAQQPAASPAQDMLKRAAQVIDGIQ